MNGNHDVTKVMTGIGCGSPFAGDCGPTGRRNTFPTTPSRTCGETLEPVPERVDSSLVSSSYVSSEMSRFQLRETVIASVRRRSNAIREDKESTERGLVAACPSHAVQGGIGNQSWSVP